MAIGRAWSYIFSSLLLVCVGGGLESFTGAEAGKVLGIFTFPASSHFGMFEALLKELAARGHQVTVVSHFPQKTPIANYTDISLIGSYHMMAGHMKIETQKEFTLMSLMKFVWEDTSRICKKAFEHPNMQKLLQSEEKFDLVVTEIFASDCAYGFAWKFNAPIIGMTSLYRMPWGQIRMGSPDNPAYFPVVYLPLTTKMTFWQRFINTAAWVYSVIGERWTSYADVDAVNRKYFGPEIPPLDELLSNTSLVFLNSHFTVNGALPEVPGVIEVAGLHVDPKAKSLPKEMEEFLSESGEHGAIYVSFGSLFHVDSTLPLPKLEAMTNALGALPQRVFWKCDGKKAAERLGRDLPANIFARSWMPQSSLLAHPKIRAFVSHGGMGGTIEGVYWGKPVLFVPLFADQHMNADNLIDRGMARKISFDDITEESFRGTLSTLLNDPSYAENARRLSQLFHDRPRTAREEAVYWSEYVMRHKDVSHMQSSAAHMHWWQIWLLDVFGAALAVIIVTMTAFVFLVRHTCCRSSPIKVKRS